MEAVEMVKGMFKLVVCVLRFLIESSRLCGSRLNIYNGGGDNQVQERKVRKSITIVILAFFILLGCATSGSQRSSDDLADFLVRYGEFLANMREPKLMIFGGRGHKVYLGCLSCDQIAPDSIFNKRGYYGRCPGLLMGDNLFCRGLLSNYGSKGLVSNTSACNSCASDPPIIVDEQGYYYGRFSITSICGHRDSVCAFGHFRDTAICEVVKWVCEQ